MRVIFYAEPINESQPLKSKSDSESEMAQWVTIKELQELAKIPPGLRGNELLDWATYIEAGGLISPLYSLNSEDQPPMMKIESSQCDPNKVINKDSWTKQIGRAHV